MKIYQNQKCYDVNKRSIRYWKDRFHAYGWQVGFKMTFTTPSGKKMRQSFSDIGTNRRTAIANALRILALWD